MCPPWIAIMASYEDYEDLYCLFREMGLTSLLHHAGEKKNTKELIANQIAAVHQSNLKLGV